ncbi:hypothetical protein AB0M95_13000 [Sphaerisporangium sp. NPDC051017]|uniref:hypothetical protein n=1 Tax=unclassified Sphaerisporangium TaxID=2630420 RepID=UPI0033F994E9
MTETPKQPVKSQAAVLLKSSLNKGYRDQHLSRGKRRDRPTAKPTRRLMEWHRMDPGERQANWARLRAWATWLHDRYELGVEERLPRCWAQHPGLIEELWALKAWREEIYDAKQPSGQAARYWHAELRQTMHAAITFYAAGCRAGHRGADGLAAEDAALQQRWATADPAAGIPAGMLQADDAAPGRSDSYLFLTAATMTTHHEQAAAVPLGTTVTDFLHHDGSWWTPGQGGWLRIIDPHLDRRLNQRSAALALADRSVERHRAFKATGRAAKGIA